MTALCPVCRGELVVGGDGWTDGGTRYWWCPYCGEARDPAAPESGQVGMTMSEFVRERLIETVHGRLTLLRLRQGEGRRSVEKVSE